MFFFTVFTLVGLGALCWLTFNMAAVALPLAIAVTSGIQLHEAGHSAAVSIAVGLFIGGCIASLGELAFERARSVFLKLAMGLTYAVPAGFAGFHVANALAELGRANDTITTILAWLGAVAIGCAAWMRVSGSAAGHGVSGKSQAHPSL
ncbi:MAG: hypothetical protein AAFO57_00805 [Pseudomonadota bacterium]